MMTNDCGHSVASEESVLRCCDCEADAAKKGEDAVWNAALEGGMASILNRCCSSMQRHGFCEHQPCDYYQNALTELRGLKRTT